MSPSDFIYDNVFKCALKKGVRERIAKDSAVMAVDRFKKNSFSGKASKLIEEYIKSAIKSEKAAKK